MATFLSGSAIWSNRVIRLDRDAKATAYNGELNSGRANLGTEGLDVFNPSLMGLEAVGRDTNELDATSSKVWGTASDFTKLSRADRGEIIGMGEENSLEKRISVASM